MFHLRGSTQIIASASSDHKPNLNNVAYGSATWHEMAREIVRILGSRAEVIPVTTAEAPRPAPRPAYSVLDTGRLVALLGRPLPPWQDALARYLGVIP